MIGYGIIEVISLKRVLRNIILYRENIERIVSISYMCNILYQFHFIVDYFLGFIL